MVGDDVSGQGSALAVGPFALTKKQCDKDIMAIEVGFLSALLGKPTWDLVNGDSSSRARAARCGWSARFERDPAAGAHSAAA